MLRVTLAALHLLALAFGIRAALARAAALRSPASSESLRRAFQADSEWGIAAVLWIATGLWRYLASIEKSTTYYNHNAFFLGKMTLLVLIFALEVWPMLTLIRWRQAIGRGAPPGAVAKPKTAGRIATISVIQALLTVLMVFAATAMARGFGAR
jgi:putative membrane protein